MGRFVTVGGHAYCLTAQPRQIVHGQLIAFAKHEGARGHFLELDPELPERVEDITVERFVLIRLTDFGHERFRGRGAERAELEQTVASDLKLRDDLVTKATRTLQEQGHVRRRLTRRFSMRSTWPRPSSGSASLRNR